MGRILGPWRRLTHKNHPDPPRPNHPDLIHPKPAQCASEGGAPPLPGVGDGRPASLVFTGRDELALQ